jgi:hypothetical protein
MTSEQHFVRMQGIPDGLKEVKFELDTKVTFTFCSELHRNGFRFATDSAFQVRFGHRDFNATGSCYRFIPLTDLFYGRDFYVNCPNNQPYLEIISPVELIAEIRTWAEKNGLVKKAAEPISVSTSVNSFDTAKVQGAYCVGDKVVVTLNVSASKPNVEGVMHTIFPGYVFLREERASFEVRVGRFGNEAGFKYSFRPSGVKDGIRDVDVFVPYSSKEMHFVRMPQGAATTIREWCHRECIFVQLTDSHDLRKRPRDVAGRETPKRQRY